MSTRIRDDLSKIEKRIHELDYALAGESRHVLKVCRGMLDVMRSLNYEISRRPKPKAKSKNRQ